MRKLRIESGRDWERAERYFPRAGSWTFYSSARATPELRANLHSESCCCIDYAHMQLRACTLLAHSPEVHGDRRHGRRNGAELDSATVTWTSFQCVSGFRGASDYYARSENRAYIEIINRGRSASFLQLRFISRSTSSFPLNSKRASIHGGSTRLYQSCSKISKTPVPLSLK